MGREKVLLVSLAILVLTLLLVGTTAAASRGSGPPEGGGLFEEIVFTETMAPSSGGPGPTATTESSSFHLTNGGIRWPAGAAVEYLIAGAPSTAAEMAVETAVSTLDGFITNRSFARVQATSQVNPCTGEANSIKWVPGDGPGGVLAMAAACFNTATKEISGFRMAMDSLESWGTAGEPDRFDVQNIATHEMGHVAGLDHVNAPKDGCLTMYKYSSLGETQNRTPGWGDKRGLDKLYATGDTAPGECGS